MGKEWSFNGCLLPCPHLAVSHFLLVVSEEDKRPLLITPIKKMFIELFCNRSLLLNILSNLNSTEKNLPLQLRIYSNTNNETEYEISGSMIL